MDEQQFYQRRQDRKAHLWKVTPPRDHRYTPLCHHAFSATKENLQSVDDPEVFCRRCQTMSQKLWPT